MKKNLLLVLVPALTAGIAAFAQQTQKPTAPLERLKSSHHNIKHSAPVTNSTTVPYTFSYSTGAYSNLVGSTTLNAGFTWDDPAFSVPLGFNFILWNDTLSTLDFNGLGGWIGPIGSGIQPFAYYLNDLVDRASTSSSWEGDPGSLSNVSYLISGNPGSRICKIEWNNAGFYDDIYTNGSSTDNLNMQMWFYETSNNIEFHFGPNSIAQDSLVYFGFAGPTVGVGLYDYDVDTLFMYSLQGNVASPTAVAATTDLNLPTLNLTTMTGDPANGMIYKFVWSFVGVNEFDAENKMVSLYPNPVSSNTMIEWKITPAPKNLSLEVMDVTGRSVYEQKTVLDGSGRMNLNLGNLAPGSYVLKLQSEEHTIYKKLIRQ